jgi:hypothetical protein
MGIGKKIFLILLAAFAIQQTIHSGPAVAVAWLIATGMAYLVWECLQAAVRAVLRLLDGNPRIEYHLYVPAPEKAAHRDPTAPDYNWDDIEMVQVNGVWRKR